MTIYPTREEWQALRRRLIAGPHGYTALREVVTLEAPQTLGATGALLVPTPEGVVLDATAAQGIILNDVPFTGRRKLQSLDEPNPDAVFFGEGWVKIETEFGRLDVQYFDAATQAAVLALEAELYPEAPEFIFRGTFRQAPEAEHEVIDLLRGGELVSRRSGWIETEIGGENYELVVIERSSYLLIAFNDGTTQAGETPRPGRFLRIDELKDGEPVTIDFNYATIMPCAFTSNYNCPLPPASNRIALALRAGEKRPLKKSEN